MPVRYIAFVAASLSFGTCVGKPGVVLTIENAGSAALDSVVVITTGHEYHLGALPAGGERKVRVRSTGESSIELEHGLTSRQRLVVGPYFEPGYRGRLRARIRADTVLSIDGYVEPY